jgi:hypothetical protein
MVEKEPKFKTRVTNRGIDSLATCLTEGLYKVGNGDDAYHNGGFYLAANFGLYTGFKARAAALPGSDFNQIS